MTLAMLRRIRQLAPDGKLGPLAEAQLARYPGEDRATLLARVAGAPLSRVKGTGARWWIAEGDDFRIVFTLRADPQGSVFVEIISFRFLLN